MCTLALALAKEEASALATSLLREELLRNGSGTREKIRVTLDPAGDKLAFEHMGTPAEPEPVGTTPQAQP